MKEKNKVGLLGLSTIVLASIEFLALPLSSITILSFIGISLGIGYLTNKLQSKIEEQK